MGKEQSPLKKALSVRDVAAQAGVSVATVSRVINRNANVRPATKARVEEIIARSNYVPNMMARGLKTDSTPIIGIVVPDISGAFYNTLVQTLQRRLLRQQHLTFVLNTAKSPDIEKEYQQWRSLLRACGWLVLDCAMDFCSGGTEPVVYVNRPGIPTDDRAVSISSDSFLGGCLAARELIRCGCKRLAVISSADRRERRSSGFISAVRESGEPDIDVMLCHVKTQDVNAETGYRRMRHILRVFPEVDGVFCIADRFVPGVWRALEEAGRHVPGQVRIVGYDDTPIASWFHGGFTTVRQDIEKMAELAVEEMMRLLREEPIQEKQVVIPVSLVRRGTT